MMKVAGVQMDIEFADCKSNLEKMRTKVAETRSAGADLTVFPECTTTGYCYRSLEEAMAQAETLEGPSVKTVIEIASQYEMLIVFGFLEKEDDKIFNSLALIGPDGIRGSYRKVHLPFLGVDRFTTAGNCLTDVFDVGDAKIGMNICYDSSFPEAARSLAISGADIICLPTNWPPTSGLTADVIPNARALENHVFFMAINRVGSERGFEFIGKSKICDPRGSSLVFANHNSEEILYADINPSLARQKHLVSIPGEHEVHRMKDRQPATYHGITRPKS
ncbi:MAG: carbon-nitrogen hydrolase family protein [Planctomycetota bacterium]